MIAWQKQIRDAQQDGHPVPKDFSSAEVREISYAEAKEVILKYGMAGNHGDNSSVFRPFLRR